jgi:molybdopterin converting factor small subunit
MKFRCQPVTGVLLRAKITVLSAGDSVGRIPAVGGG